MMRFFRWAVVGLAAILAACSQAGSAVQMTTEPLAQPTPAPTMSPPTPAPTPEATEPPPLSLSVWWPEPLLPVGDISISVVVSEQIEAFEAQNPAIVIASRLKKPRDVGGIMETLRSAAAVAPGALPDLTLLRREDLLAAQQAGLIQPLEGRVSSAVMGNLYTAALELGQVNGQLYGLPYMLDVLHVAYWGSEPSGDFATFDNVLARNRAFTFPAGAGGSVNSVFLLQYLSAGGNLADISVGEVNADALRRVLSFYEQAVTAGVIEPAVLNYTTYAEYVPALRDRSVLAGVVPSSVYLGFGAAGQALAFAPIPVEAGQPTTVLNGWMWVLTTPRSEQQAAASRFLDWMLSVERQSRYSQAANMLPSLRASVRQSGINSTYADFVTQLLGNAVLPVVETAGSSTMRAMQNGLASVISNQRTAEQAAQDVLNQLAG